ncbi:pyruvate formate-lyase-activating protein [Clostridium cellulovorans]|uniref:Pyruvate formate-lyase-activating enzyme n=1 Tax=Clostridium cellulovorans (strain ATCC 35296 / DSM 3052 / OCM 3 / 743B) TaxID=573061 RepID=D9SL40_CLOC7|nr:pyruvate formate-lyase-activating protein [Clostridium cellulovorans]ADL51556.1 pyruvate formate-lyase activating enzyme [Clostridium cellulovorans 743B]
MTVGRVHSFESMGLLDGPGIRNIVFLQGCNLRCLYCHNPDTWACNGGTEYTPEQLLKKIVRFKPYFEKSGGGVTFSGGEPLLQYNFLIEALKLCKENGIHTAIDTAGVGMGNYEEVLKYTDLVLLDIKHYDEIKYKEITGRDNSEFKKFLEALKNSNSKVWIRHVVVPGINDTKEDVLALCEYIKDIPRIEKVDLLPYHVLGVNKYDVMGIEYRLKDLQPMSKEKAEELKAFLKENWKSE